MAAHWRRNGFATWLFQPAVTGWYPKKAPQATRPVPVLAEPWPGIPVRGRNGSGRADACWVPIARGLTPHGLRHTHKTLMEELGGRKAHGRADGPRGRLRAGPLLARHGADAGRLLEGLTELWERALEARRSWRPGHRWRPSIGCCGPGRPEVGERSGKIVSNTSPRWPLETESGPVP